MLSKLISRDQKDWDECLPLTMLAYRSSVRESTKQTPNLMMHGQKAQFPIDLLYGPPPDEAKQVDLHGYMNTLRTLVPFTVYQCQECPVGFPTAVPLSSHEEQVHGPQNVCPFAGCGVSFPRQKPDRMHRNIQRVHPVLRRGSPVGQSVANGRRMRQRPVVGPTMVEAVVDEELPQIENWAVLVPEESLTELGSPCSAPKEGVHHGWLTGQCF
ncbi:unnamed protein product [Mytilus coruscus]|uniref:C2H2-type domain-containing protein n=1 Tax=Mytilus coruscus TaxID=42192 RepID=A0A6J8BWV4_MYTCO|nr:unnamed protein product [Mytilus coruscus]